MTIPTGTLALTVDSSLSCRCFSNGGRRFDVTSSQSFERSGRFDASRRKSTDLGGWSSSMPSTQACATDFARESTTLPGGGQHACESRPWTQ